MLSVEDKKLKLLFKPVYEFFLLTFLVTFFASFLTWGDVTGQSGVGVFMVLALYLLISLLVLAFRVIKIAVKDKINVVFTILPVIVYIMGSLLVIRITAFIYVKFRALVLMVFP